MTRSWQCNVIAIDVPNPSRSVSVFCVGFSNDCFTPCTLKPRDCWLISVRVSVVFPRVGWTSSVTTPIALNCFGFLAGFSLIEITLTFVRAFVWLRLAGATTSAWMAFGVWFLFVFMTVKREPDDTRSMISEKFISHFGELSFPEGKVRKYFHNEMITMVLTLLTLSYPIFYDSVIDGIVCETVFKGSDDVCVDTLESFLNTIFVVGIKLDCDVP